MGDGIYAALSGAIAQTTALDATAQNLANAGTQGYRSLRPIFREVMSNAAVEGQPLRFTAVSGTRVDTTMGRIEETGRGLDVVLPEDSFIAVQTDAGERYTRAGSLQVGADNILRAPGGFAVLSETKREPIKANPLQQLAMNEDGRLLVDGVPSANIRIVSFNNPEELTPEGASLFNATAEAGAAQPSGGKLRVGALEHSNASPIMAMHEMISTTRTFEAVEKVMQAFNEADRKVISSVPTTR